MTVPVLSPREAAAAAGTVEPVRPRLLDVNGAAVYLGVSTWTVRDYVANGTIPAVRLPAARVDVGRRRRNGKRRRYALLQHDDPRLRSADPVRRILIDLRDLDALIDRSKDAGQPIAALLATASKVK